MRYRPITTGLESSSQAVTHARKSRADARVTTAPAAPDDLDREQEHLQRPRRTAPVGLTRTKRSVHPLLFIGLDTLITLLLWVGITQLVAWGTNEYNALVYGIPPTFQIDAVTGQGDSPQHPSHFESIDLHGMVTILEFPAGDPNHVRQLTTLAVPADTDHAVAFLRFIDVSHNGRPDLLITIDGVESVMVNDGKTFRQPTPTEEQQILQQLQRQNSIET